MFCVGEQATRNNQIGIDGQNEVMVNLLKPGDKQVVSVMQRAPNVVSGGGPCFLFALHIGTVPASVRRRLVAVHQPVLFRDDFG